jgi:hypothetical protein
MVKCPNCRNEVTKLEKKWTYGPFEVRAYLCDKCATDFREYIKGGKLSFILKATKKGKHRYIKLSL